MPSSSSMENSAIVTVEDLLTKQRSLSHQLMSDSLNSVNCGNSSPFSILQQIEDIVFEEFSVEKDQDEVDGGNSDGGKEEAQLILKKCATKIMDVINNEMDENKEMEKTREMLILICKMMEKGVANNVMEFSEKFQLQEPAQALWELAAPAFFNAAQNFSPI